MNNSVEVSAVGNDIDDVVAKATKKAERWLGTSVVETQRGVFRELLNAGPMGETMLEGTFTFTDTNPPALSQI